MSAKRGESGLAGILVVDKPKGLTSHDVIGKIRHALGERRVGHTGTLDPMATGVLVVLVGPATRLAPYLASENKSYLARVVFGTATDTDDADGRVVASAPVPDEACDPFAAASMVASLVGQHLQVPPIYSAIKVGGRASHRAARAGVAVDLRPRVIRIEQARLVGIDAANTVRWNLELVVSKGTYVRSIARDLGEAMGSAAHLGALRRTACGHLSLADAVSLQEIEDEGSQASRFFVDPVRALGVGAVDLDERGAKHVADGRPLSPQDVCAPIPPAGLVALRFSHELRALYEVSGQALQPRVVFPVGITGGCS